MLPLPKKSVLHNNIARGFLKNTKERDPSLLWLDKNENTDPKLSELTSKLLSEIDPIHCISVYPEITDFYSRLSLNLKIPASNIIISTGSDGVIRSIFEAYCSDGDKVMITNPSYAMYEVYSLMYGANLIKYDYIATNNGPLFDISGFINSIKENKPKIIFIANPDSPTGTVIEESKLLEIIKIAEKTNSLIAIDEAYYPFYNRSVIGYCSQFKNLVVIRTFSKAWGITGLRVGYGVGNEEVISILRRVKPNYETNSVGIAVANKMLDYEDEVNKSVDRLNQGRDFFISKMEELNLKTIRTNASFLHVNFGVYDKKIRKALSEIVLYRYEFNHKCLEGYSRFSSTSKDLFKPIVNSIENTIKNNKY